MPVPTRRWFVIAGLTGCAMLLGYVWNGALAVVLLADLAWVIAWLWDARRASARPVTVRREAPAAFSVGRTMPVWYDWETTLEAPQRMRVREHFPAALGGAAVPEREVRLLDGTTRERVDLTPVHRGREAGGTITVRRLGPLGLGWHQQRLRVPWEPTVFPSLAGVAARGLPAQARRRREAGLRAVRRPGEGRLFEALREWVPGDDTRIIDWKATARRRKPIARVYEDERRQQVIVMLDAGRLLMAESDGTARLEHAIRAALQLAYAAVEHDDDVGLLVFADTVQGWVAPHRGRRGVRGVLEALATVEGRQVESDYPAAFRFLAQHNRKRALTVLFTDVIDREASAALVAQVATLRPRHLPVAVTLRDPALERLAVARPLTEAEAYERAAAEELLQARERALDGMRRQGVVVLDVPPEAAAEAVVQRYHQLKRRGAL